MLPTYATYLCYLPLLPTYATYLCHLNRQPTYANNILPFHWHNIIAFIFLFSPIQDIDLPELPDFLKPEASTTGRPLTPIQDIDLPNGFEVVHEGGQELTPEEISKQEETSGEDQNY